MSASCFLIMPRFIGGIPNLPHYERTCTRHPAKPLRTGGQCCQSIEIWFVKKKIPLEIWAVVYRDAPQERNFHFLYKNVNENGDCNFFLNFLLACSMHYVELWEPFLVWQKNFNIGNFIQLNRECNEWYSFSWEKSNPNCTWIIYKGM